MATMTNKQTLSLHQKIAKNRGANWRKNLVKGRIEATLNPTFLKLLRIKKNLMQEDVARRLGVPDSTYGSIERGKTYVKSDRAEKIAKIIGVPVSKIFSSVNKNKLVATVQKSSV